MPKFVDFTTQLLAAAEVAAQEFEKANREVES